MNDTVDSVVPVTQEDREAAAALAEWLTEQQNQWQGMAVFFSSTFPSMCREGRFDEHEFVQDFARHRLTAERKHEAEVERLREALRLWDESALMSDYDEEGNRTPRDLDLIGPAQGGDVYLAAKATRQALGESQ